MTFGSLVQQFFHDSKVEWALILVGLDFILGVLAAVKIGTFRLSYVADVLRNDVAFKLVPYFVLWAGAAVAPSANVVGNAIDVSQIADAVYVVVLAAWVASIGRSLLQLGLEPGGTLDAKTMLLGGENAAPPKD